jgi:hypothetical protein
MGIEQSNRLLQVFILGIRLLVSVQLSAVGFQLLKADG